MKQEKTQVISHDNGVELLVTFDYQEEIQIEECHGVHTFYNYDIEVTYVEIVIAGENVVFPDKKVNILPLLNKKQLEHIEELLDLNDND
jgi:hypothetical protein